MGSLVSRKKRSHSFTIRSFQALRSQISSSSSSLLVQVACGSAYSVRKPPMLVYKRFAVSLCFFFFLSVIFVGRAQEDQILTNCPASGANYTADTQYETNLNELLPALASNAVSNIDTYYYTSIGSDPDRIYGYAQCMSAATASSCRACLNKSITDLLGERCPRKKRATIRYYSCIMRYSDRTFFYEKYDPSLIVYTISQGDVAQPTLFNAQLSSLMKNLSDEAVLNSSRLAWGRATYNEFSNIYGLAQCTRDLLPYDCSSCLEVIISNIPACCENKIGGGLYFPNCNIRFESSPFDPASRLPPPLPATPSSPPNPGSNKGKRNSRHTVILIVVPIAGIAAGIAIVTMIYATKKKQKNTADKSEVEDVESMKFSLASIRAATDDFSEANKVGEGGFGAVYKGRLPDGQVVAVKRLSGHSNQGSQEFKNEVALIAVLQHRNLVRLLGWCLLGNEKILIYEFVPNKSLDKFLFGPVKQAQLDWPRRYQIIEGIARGLLFLHEDSRLRVVHRDLKSGNVLLDAAMNPKISDFGLARIFAAEQSHGNTNRIAGTYGYMAPEYAMRGLFSVKSDVYSFGVLVLEIVTGRKNTFLIDSGEVEDLPSHAWRHWQNRTVMEMVDPAVRESCSANEVIRCVHIALLCVQDDAAKRPSMSSVALILKSHSVTLPFPSQPTFFRSGADSEHDLSRGGQPLLSGNDLSITDLIPR